ncbi:MAG: alcohol dehydrogenase catalytic domain-containing protein [Clostridia bacterium]
MLQVKLAGVKQIITNEVSELNPPEPGWATVETKAVGICGSEMHVYLGENPVLSPPRIQGHEFSGVVKAINGESQIKVGDTVTVNPVVACGICQSCKDGKRYLCDKAYVIGGEVTGAFAGEVYVPIRNLVPVDKKLSFCAATLIEPTSVAVHTVGNLRNQTILIIGQGAIGLLCLQVALQNGNRVITMDVSDQVLAVSLKLGSVKTINSKTQNAAKELEEFLGGEPLNAIIDVVCAPVTIGFSIDHVQKGGTIIVVGIPQSNFAFDLVKLLCKEIKLHTSYLYSEEDFLKARSLVDERVINEQAIISKRFPFENTADAFEYKLNVPSIKVVVEK